MIRGTRYVVQQRGGYTDGTPSWLKLRSYFSLEEAEAALPKIMASLPKAQLRIRKITRK